MGAVLLDWIKLKMSGLFQTYPLYWQVFHSAPDLIERRDTPFLLMLLSCLKETSSDQTSRYLSDENVLY